MAYPSFAQIEGTAHRFADDRSVVRDTGGAARVAAFYDSARRTFTVKHLLTGADLATLEAFYAANRVTSFSFTYSLDGATYTCVFGQNAIRVTPRAVHHDVTVELEEAA